jgi:hypothetical protein
MLPVGPNRNRRLILHGTAGAVIKFADSLRTAFDSTPPLNFARGQPALMGCRDYAPCQCPGEQPGAERNSLLHNKHINGKGLATRI